MAFDPSLFDSLLEPTFLIDEKARVRYCNEAAALLSGISTRRIMRASSITDVFCFTPETENQWIQRITKVKEPTPYKELLFKNAIGETGKVQITLQPFPSEGDPLWLVYFRDVTLEETLQTKYRAELDQKELVIDELQRAQASLEDYSKNLERMVEERTAELRSVNRTLSALLNSLGQGFFIFDKNGLCLPVYSKACEETLECEPGGLNVWDVLKVPVEQKENFKKWIFTLFSEMLPFDDIAALAPQRLEHSRSREIALSYYPVRDEQGAVAHTVVMASDITSEVQARQEAEVERSRAKRILKLVSNLNRTHTFIREAKKLLARLKGFTSADFDPNSKTEVFRLLHTLKGAMATFSIDEIRDICHNAESSLAKTSSQTPDQWQEVQRLSAEIDDSFDQFLKTHNDLIGDDYSSKEHRVTVRTETVIELVHRLHEMSSERIKEELVHRLLLEPASHYVGHYQNFVQEVAEEQHKKLAPLRITNGDILIYGAYYENLFESFVHLFRNSIDHGIEPPGVRLNRGKPEEGRIRMAFSIVQEKDEKFIQIQVTDDGSGIDVEGLISKLKSSGVDTSSLTEHEILQHVFDSGLSTREKVTQTSGRGVGMDAVLHSSRMLGGTAWVESLPGRGTTTTVRVPFLLPYDKIASKAAA